MTTGKSFSFSWVLLLVATLLLFLLDLSLGSVHIPFSQTLAILSGQEVENQAWQQIILLFRLPRVITALSVGAALSVSGLLMQSLFRNPLAGSFSRFGILELCILKLW
jgi:iron complex transport system permease protein